MVNRKEPELKPEAEPQLEISAPVSSQGNNINSVPQFSAFGSRHPPQHGLKARVEK